MTTPRVAVIGCGKHATNNIIPALRFTEMELAAIRDAQNGRSMQLRFEEI